MRQSSSRTPPPPDNPYYITMNNLITHKEIAQTFNLPYPLPVFNEERTAEELSNCKHWAIPDAPDEDAKNWYRAATTLHAINSRTVEQHQQMLQLYEAAARRGHYLAIKNLTIWYMEGGLVIGARFKADPPKASYWLTKAIREHRWEGTLEWVPYIMGSNGSGLDRKDYKLAYLQAAANEGVALAQWQLSAAYKYRREKEVALLICAADQGQSAAADKMGMIYEAREQYDQSLHYYQIAVMNGGLVGGEAAFAMQTFSYKNTELNLAYGKGRRGAYNVIDDSIRGTVGKRGNYFLRFPRLNEVLPLPPAEVTEWGGIYAAMSEDDASYYQNPPPASFYLKQVEEAGLLIPIEHLVQPYYPKKGESLV